MSTPEELLTDLLARFNGFQESLPAQLQQLSDLIINLEQKTVSMEEKSSRIRSDVHEVIDQTRNAIENLSSSLKTYMHENFVSKNSVPAANSGNLSVDRIRERQQANIKVKAPITFTGKRSTCDLFFTQLALVFHAQPDIYVSDRQKIIYALSHVDQGVLNYFKPFLEDLEEQPEANHDILNNYIMFKETIVHAFGDPNPVYHAESDLNRLKQTGSVAEYASIFRRTIAVLNDEAYQAAYKHNLKDFVKNELARRQEPFGSLDELIKYTVDIENPFVPKIKKYGDQGRQSSLPKVKQFSQ